MKKSIISENSLHKLAVGCRQDLINRGRWLEEVNLIDISIGIAAADTLTATQSTPVL